MAASSWNFGHDITDKLRIFVSSRIGECREERTAVRQAIHGLNHEAVLFEHLGSRPYAPRRLYLTRLRRSQVMVAIYRDGYGYVDVNSGMSISGLEDELRIARQYNVKTLLYVFHDDTNRDEKLRALIDEAGGWLTRSSYSTSADLASRVREDVTTVIAQGYLSAEAHQGILLESASELLQRGARVQGALIERPDVLDRIFAMLRATGIGCVFGPGGIGKTVAVAQLAHSRQGVFLRVAGQAPKDIFAVAADALSKSGVVSGSYPTYAAARKGFISAWQNMESIFLVIDECDFIEDVIAAVADAGGHDEKKLLLFTARTCPSDVPGISLPALTLDEIAVLDPRGAVSGTSISPLMIQQAIANDELSLSMPDPRAREVLSYLALSPTSLSADALIDLIGDQTLTIETLFGHINALGRIVDDSPGGYRLLHSESAERLRAELSDSPQRMQFYSARLANYFDSKGDQRFAYVTTDRLNDDSAARFASAALRQSSMIGDWRLAISIAERLLNSALDTERKSDAFELMIQLAFQLEVAGDSARAADILDKAGAFAVTLGEDAISSHRGALILSRARRTLSAQDIQSLEDMKATHAQQGDDWNAARLGLELSAIYISAKHFDKAVYVLRASLSIFRSENDEFGVDLCERNLAQSLAALPGNDREVDRLLGEIAERSEDNIDTRRQRAWVCNLLTQQYRRSGRLEDARRSALEALRHAEDLNDESLRALNLVNLGNVERDARNGDAALEAYDEAGLAAQRCGRRDIEADASRLRASILNDQGVETSGIDDRHTRAAFFAEHAIGLLRGSIYHESLGRSLLEAAEAYKELGRNNESALAYFDAVGEFREILDEEAANYALIAATRISGSEYPDTYLHGVSCAVGAELVEGRSIADEFIELIGPIVRCVSEKGLISVFGRHLLSLQEKLPPALKRILFERVVEVLERLTKDGPLRDQWRLHHAAIVAPLLAHDYNRDFALSKLAQMLVKNDEFLSVREVDGNYVWTVLLHFDRPVIVTVQTLDCSFSSAVAALCLSSFFRAFESEWRTLVSRPTIEEVWIQLAAYGGLPEDMQLALDNMGVNDHLAESQVAVTRPSDFDASTPTFVVLGPEFLKNSMNKNGIGGSIHFLLGRVLTEFAYQLMRGEVNEDEIRPKIVSVVRRTIP